jgi:hypothetical protein
MQGSGAGVSGINFTSSRFTPMIANETGKLLFTYCCTGVLGVRRNSMFRTHWADLVHANGLDGHRSRRYQDDGSSTAQVCCLQ